MESRTARFRRQVEAHFGRRPSRGSRYPESLRAEAVEIVSGELVRGVGLSAVGGDLGVSAGTLRRWIEASPRRAGQLRAVEVVASTESPREDGGRREGLVLVTANGHRVEGLSLAEVALLLEALA